MNEFTLKQLKNLQKSKKQKKSILIYQLSTNIFKITPILNVITCRKVFIYIYIYSLMLSSFIIVSKREGEQIL